MTLSLSERVQQCIARHSMLRAGDRVAVAVSGGADSVALLSLLHSLHLHLGVTLCVAHFNHQLRGGESDADEAFVASLANALGLQLISERADISSRARENGWNLEDAGRRLRYRFFAELIQSGAARRVATAHTADDQAETVLARIIRGSGLSGLAGIYPVREGIIRPILDVRRAELRDFLHSTGQEWREDPSNADTRRLRARVRQNLVPYMEQNFTKNAVERLASLAALAHVDANFWKALAEQACSRFVRREGQARSIDAKRLLSLWDSVAMSASANEDRQRALSQRIIRKLHSELAHSGELSQKHVEQVMQLAESAPTGKRLKLPGGVQVEKGCDRLNFTVFEDKKLASRRSQNAPLYSYGVEIPADGTAAISVAEIGRQFRLKVIDWPAPERETKGAGVVLDAERLRPPLVLRNWKPGDAYRPLGRQSPQKLARLFAGSRIGRAEREGWPVLTSAEQVAWVYHMPVAAEYSVGEGTRTGLWIFEDSL